MNVNLQDIDGCTEEMAQYQEIMAGIIKHKQELKNQYLKLRSGINRTEATERAENFMFENPVLMAEFPEDWHVILRRCELRDMGMNYLPLL